MDQLRAAGRINERMLRHAKSLWQGGHPRMRAAARAFERTQDVDGLVDAIGRTLIACREGYELSGAWRGDVGDVGGSP